MSVRRRPQSFDAFTVTLSFLRRDLFIVPVGDIPHPPRRVCCAMVPDVNRLILAAIITFAVLFAVLMFFLGIRQFMAYHYGKRTGQEGDVESLLESGPVPKGPSMISTSPAVVTADKINNKPLPLRPMLVESAQDRTRNAQTATQAPHIDRGLRMPPPPSLPLPRSAQLLSSSRSQSRQPQSRAEPPGVSEFLDLDSSESEDDKAHGEHKATKRTSLFTSPFRRDRSRRPKQAAPHVRSQQPTVRSSVSAWAIRRSQIATMSQHGLGESQEVPLLLTPAPSQTAFQPCPDSPCPARSGSHPATPETVVVGQRDTEVTGNAPYTSEAWNTTTGGMI